MTLLRWNEQLEQEAASILGIQKGSLRIGTIISLSAEILPRVLKRFWAQYPGITVRIREGGDHEVLEWLQEGRIDCLHAAPGSLEWRCEA